MISKGRRTLLISVNLGHTMAHIYPYLLPVLNLVIREEIVMNYTQAAILSMVGILMMIPLTILFGFVGDLIRNWRLELIAGGFLLVFSHTFILYFAKTYAMLILAAVICGVGASIFHPIALPLLSQEFGADRSIAHSFNLIFGTMGSIITPIGSIALSQWLGWRIAALIFGIFGAIFFPIFLILLLLGKKELQYKEIPKGPIETTDLGRATAIESNKKEPLKRKIAVSLSFIGLPLIALVFAQIFQSGIFQILNTFTAFIFEDRFGASKLVSASIMSIIIGSGGIIAFISGFISRKRGSLKIFVFSTLGTTIAAVLVTVFVGAVDITGTVIGMGILILSIFLFMLLAMSFYSGIPPSNALIAEMIPPKVLSSTSGVISASMSSFSALTPVLFGLIVDRGFELPYEYLLLVAFAAIPLMMLLYIKSKIGFKTPDEIEEERTMVTPAYETQIGK